MALQSGKKNIPKIASERLLIKGGKIVNPEISFYADIFIENGIIRQLGNDLIIPSGVTTIDAQGALVFPGGIDVSTNFDSSPHMDHDCDFKTVDNFYSGTRAALLGGTTTVLDFVSGDEGRLISTFQERIEASSISCCDVGFHVDVTKWNDEVKQAMTSLAIEQGVNSFRVHMSGRWQLDDWEIYEVLEHIKSLGGIALVHAENGSLVKKCTEDLKKKGITQPEDILQTRREEFEVEAVNRVILIAGVVKCPLFFWNVTSEKSIEAISNARRKGQLVYGQALAIALIQNGSVYRQKWEQAAASLTWPPLRDHAFAQQQLLEALGSGDLWCVSSGHCVYADAMKAMAKGDFSKIPPGTSGAYERMMALWSRGVVPGIIDQHQFVSLTSTNAAKLFNLFPQKGYIAVGSDADLVLWRERDELLLNDKLKNFNISKPECTNPFLGFESYGGPVAVICHGKVVFNDNQVNVIQSLGNLLKRPLHSPFVYDRIKIQEEISKEQSFSNETIKAVYIPGSNLRGNNVKVFKTPEKPERYTRNCGHRAMHQSGWSFSGEQVDDSVKPKNNRYSTPPGGLSHFSLT
ncbi:unnamed protein product [Clavelina lepadiformis]|uniref:dihydropyrimidinase n=1 Tax=Clavelina lepadiformis TaxID=159417 RepID=A0ABP0FUI3_CLALP